MDVHISEEINGWSMKQWALVFAEMDLNYTSIESTIEMQSAWRGKHSASGPDEEPLVASPDGIDHRPASYTDAALFFESLRQRRIMRIKKGQQNANT